MILNKVTKPNKVYADVVESGAIDQFVSAMEQPFAVRGALMPDVHKGYSLPIGAVVETKGVVVPSWVGYDIGCGMCAVKTSFDFGTITNQAQQIHRQILKNIPVGFAHRQYSVVECGNLDQKNLTKNMRRIYTEKQGDLQLGTLGGGNHFIEIGTDYDFNIWIIIHSGSRGVGHGCATHYMKLASPNGKASEGHYGFDVDSQNGQDYILDMNWCLEYALWNRKVMLFDIVDSIRQCDIDGGMVGDIINRNHNHAETKDGVHWIHRKGATHAEDGMMGVIPGNMRDGSFIVRGKGNPDSLCSSSHGAGRVLGRAKAKEMVDLELFQQSMHGIVANVSEDTKDESPFAYKNIFDVMELQEDLVDVVTYVQPILNVKG